MRNCIVCFLVSFFLSGCVYYEAEGDTATGVDWCSRLERTACNSCSWQTCQTIRASIYDDGASDADCKYTYNIYSSQGCPE